MNNIIRNKGIPLLSKVSNPKDPKGTMRVLPIHSNDTLNMQTLSLHDSTYNNNKCPKKQPLAWDDEYNAPEEDSDSVTSERETLLTTAFKHARRGSWSKLKKMLQTDSGDLICSMRDSSGLSLLSVVVISNPPLDILNMILSLNPSATLEPDEFGVVPITLACMNGASAEVIRTILQHDNGMSATVPDSDKRVALHHAVECAARIDVSELSEEQSKAVFDSFHFSDASDCSTKLSTSASSNMDLSNDAEVLELLCDAAPEMIHFASSNGDTPLDVMHIVRGRCKSESQRTMVEYLYYSILRKASIALYLERKKEWEEYGHEDY